MSEHSHDSNGSEPRVFVDPDTGFSVKIPKGWLVDTSGQRGSKVILYHPTAEEGFRANINVLVHDLAPLTPEEYLTLSRLQLKQLTGFAQLPTDASATDRPDAHIFEWMTDRPTPPVRVRQLVVFAESRAITISATASLDRFESYRAEFDQVLDSFSLTEAE